MPSTDYDVIIIGAGHNGLTTAAYLAKAGLRVLSLERRNVLGGATLTDEIFPGYRLPRYSYAALLLEGKVVQDLDLESHGLKVLPVDPERIHPFPDGRAVRVWNDDAQVAEEIARISLPDADAYLKWVDFWVRAARIIHPYMLTAPPTLAEVMASVQGTDDEAVLERILFGSAYDMLDQFFESEQVKALFAWSFNDAPLFFARLETSRFGDPRYHGILQGGMGSLPRSIEQAARSYGAQFETNAEVRRVLIENGSAIGVELADGRQIRAGTVVSNLDPKRSLLDIVDEGHLPSDFRARIRSLKNMRASMKLHASLSEPPDLSPLLWRRLGPRIPGPGQDVPQPRPCEGRSSRRRRRPPSPPPLHDHANPFRLRPFNGPRGQTLHVGMGRDRRLQSRRRLLGRRPGTGRRHHRRRTCRLRAQRQRRHHRQAGCYAP